MQETHTTDRDIFKALDAHKLEQAVTAEEERLRRIRRQMREQDDRRFADPTKRADDLDVYALFAWQKVAPSKEQRKQGMRTGFRWQFITQLRGKITPKRLVRLRHKYRKRIADTDVVRVVEMRAARFLEGAGAPPQLPPRSKRPVRLAKANRVLAQQVTTTKRRRPATDTRLSKCEHRKGSKRCPFRAPWYIGYTDSRTRRRIVRKRCGRHAWDDRFLPAHAKQVVRVSRVHA